MVPPVRSATIETAAYPVSFQVKIGQWFAPLLLIAVDYLMVVSAFIVAFVIRTALLPKYFPDLQPFAMPDGQLYFMIPFVYICFLAYERLYTRRVPFWQGAELLFRVSVFGAVSVVGLLYLTGQIAHISRIFMLLGWGLSFVYLLCGRFLAKRLMAELGIWQKPVIVVGSGKTAELFAQAVEEESNMGYRIAGVIDDLCEERTIPPQYPLLGNIHLAEKIVMSNGSVQDVVIAAPGLSREKMLGLINSIQPYVSNVSIVPDLFGRQLSNMEVETLINHRAVLIRTTNNLKNTWNCLFKRSFDMLFGSIILFFTLPIMLGLAIVVKLDSPGPVLYNAKRLGKDGKEFLCYKFRTMYLNSDDMLQEYLQNNPEAEEEFRRFAKLRTYDPRVTGAGKWMRKFSLDELPQVLNVLKGEMSLVGPRPYLPREKNDMGMNADTILYTTPGITGLWQVSGRNHIDFEGRLQMDVWYVRNWSLWIDIMLLFKTINTVLLRKGAY